MFTLDNSKKPYRFPLQNKPFKSKGKLWRTQCTQWGIDNLYAFGEVCRKSIKNKKINFDLVNGKIHMDDLEYMLNPHGIKTDYHSDSIQHFPVMNSKLDLLRGEELARVFDYRVVVTNPNAISDIEDRKKAELFNKLQQLIENQSLSQEQYQQEVQRLAQYYVYEYQDVKEVNANCVLNHYRREQNFPLLFNEGFNQSFWSDEEVYQLRIVGGEPTIRLVDPFKLHVFMSGSSNKIEDADMIIYDDFCSPAQIYDAYYDVLTEKDIKYIEERAYSSGEEANDLDYDVMDGLYLAHMQDDTMSVNDMNSITPHNIFEVDENTNEFVPYDMCGNIRVTTVYWKSRKLIKKVKSFNPITGEEEITFHSESYVVNKELGEECEDLWVNEAWEGTKIGKDTYVNMRPCPVQYNTISNPSKCHFGFIGTINNSNSGSKPYGLVDRMKPICYLYDVTHDRLHRLLARNMGKLVRMDLARIPQSKGWDVDKWLYFAKTCGIAVEDSFNEGDYGAATGKIVGGLNNATTGVIDAELGNTIQQYLQILEYIKNELSEMVGISKQREGQISNRETVGGVERATLQSSHITEWLFATHDDVKKRVLEGFLHMAKVAMMGSSKKFQYIVPGWSSKILEIDGDDFAEADYGLLVDNSRETQELAQKLDMLAQAGLQNQLFNFSTVLQLYTSCSLSEKIVMMKQAEQEAMQRQQEAQQQQQQLAQQQMEQQAQLEQAKMQQEDMLNQRDNETKLLIANMNALAGRDADGDGVIGEGVESQDDLMQRMKEFDEKMRLERDKLAWDKQKNADNNKVKLEIARMKPKSNNK